MTGKREGVGFLAIGSELLDGRVHESNALYAARALAEHGVKLAGVVLCDDVESEIIAALDCLAQITSLIVISGGLGPTTDDLTREALASYCDVPLIEDAEALDGIKELFAKRQRSFSSTNAKQALFPKGAHIIKNPLGTAPGFLIDTNRHGRDLRIFSLPGVPREYTTMFMDTVKNEILSFLKVSDSPPQRLIRVFGIGESEIGSRIELLKLDPSLQISYRAHFPEIQVKIGHAENETLVSDAMRRVESCIGEDYIFARELVGKLEDVSCSALINAGQSIALAESCTGGAIGNLITNVPGASRVFMGSAVVYANHAKSELLGVAKERIDKYGAVSAEVAEQMAVCAKERLGASLGLAITGIAGPDGGSQEKPVGTYYIALATAKECQIFRLFYLSTRENFKRYVAYVALDILRRYALNLPLTPYQII